MTEPMNIPTLKTIFRFPFQGKGWQSRFLFGVGFIFVSYIIPLIPLIFVGGYLLEVMRRAAKGEELVLPEWSDWGRLGVNGLKSALINLIFLLPGSIVMIGGWVIYMASSGIMASSAMYSNNTQAAAIPFFMAAILVFFISLFIGPILLALGGIPLPAAVANMAAEGKLAAAFHLHQWWPALWKNKLGYFIAFAIFIGLASILYFASMMVYVTIICCWLIPLLMAPAGFYLALVYAALFGETFRQSMVSEPASPPAEGVTAPVEGTPAPAVAEIPASQPAAAAETPAEATPAAESQDKPKPASATRRKKTPPAPETPA